MQAAAITRNSRQNEENTGADLTQRRKGAKKEISQRINAEYFPNNPLTGFISVFSVFSVVKKAALIG